LGYSKVFMHVRARPLIDDHVRYKQAGIRAIDVSTSISRINTPPKTTIDKVSARVCRLL